MLVKAFHRVEVDDPVLVQAARAGACGVYEVDRHPSDEGVRHS